MQGTAADPGQVYQEWKKEREKIGEHGPASTGDEEECAEEEGEGQAHDLTQGTERSGEGEGEGDRARGGDRKGPSEIRLNPFEPTVEAKRSVLQIDPEPVNREENSDQEDEDEEATDTDTIGGEDESASEQAIEIEREIVGDGASG